MLQKVDTEIVRTAEFFETISMDGQFDANVTAQGTVFPAVRGKVLRVYVKVGDVVKLGQALAMIDAPRVFRDVALPGRIRPTLPDAKQSQEVQIAQRKLQEAGNHRDAAISRAQEAAERAGSGVSAQQIGELEEQVDQARNSAVRAKTEYEKRQSMYDQGFISRSKMEAARLEYDSAQKALLQAEMQLREMQTKPRQGDSNEARKRVEEITREENAKVDAALRDLQSVSSASSAPDFSTPSGGTRRIAEESPDAKIAAPFDGKVSRLFIREGEIANPKNVAFEILRKDFEREFVGAVTKQDSKKFKVGSGVILAGARDPVGKVISIGEANPRTGVCLVRVGFHKVPYTTPGQFLTLRIVTSRKTSLAIPTSAAPGAGRKLKVVVFENGLDRDREVELGPDEQGFRRVVSGLKLGEQIVRPKPTQEKTKK